MTAGFMGCRDGVQPFAAQGEQWRAPTGPEHRLGREKRKRLKTGKLCGDSGGGGTTVWRWGLKL